MFILFLFMFFFLFFIFLAVNILYLFIPSYFSVFERFLKFQKVQAYRRETCVFIHSVGFYWLCSSPNFEFQKLWTCWKMIVNMEFLIKK